MQFAVEDVLQQIHYLTHTFSKYHLSYGIG